MVSRLCDAEAANVQEKGALLARESVRASVGASLAQVSAQMIVLVLKWAERPVQVTEQAAWAGACQALASVRSG